MPIVWAFLMFMIYLVGTGIWFIATGWTVSGLSIILVVVVIFMWVQGARI